MGKWQRIQRISPPVNLANEFGWVNFGLTDLQGDNLLVGAPFADHDGWVDAGKAFLYRYESQSNSWQLTDEFKSNNSNDNEFFGHVSLADNVIVIGATFTKINDIGTGRVYIYTKDTINNNWQEIQQIDSPFINSATSFGLTVLARNDELYISIKKISETQNEGVYLYKRDNSGQYVMDSLLVPDGTTPYARFGQNILLAGDRLIISAAAENLQPAGSQAKNDGAVYYYIRDNSGNWVRQQKLVSPSLELGGIFGGRIALENNVLLVTDVMEIPNRFVFQTVVHQYQLDTLTNQWVKKQTIAYLEPGTLSQSFTGLGFDGQTAALWAIESSTGKRIAGVYTMKMVPENKIDLVLNQSVSVTEIKPGNNFTVNYEVINQGQDTATGITFFADNSRFVSSSTTCALNDRQVVQCGIMDLLPDEKQSFSLTYQVDLDETISLRFIATVRTTEGEADSTNNGVLTEMKVVKPPPPPASSGGSFGILLIFFLSGYALIKRENMRLSNHYTTLLHCHD